MKKALFCIIILVFATIPCYCQGNHKPAAPKTPLDKKLDFFVEKLRKEKFTVLKSKKDIPDFIKGQLTGFNDQSLADPGEKFQEPADSIVDSTLPGRKLVFLAKSNDLIVINYLRGGAKSGEHLALIQYKGEQIIDVLPRAGCTNCTSIKAIIHFINMDRAIK
jgi:hypothetical protein